MKTAEELRTVYEGENGEAWVAFLDAKKAEGWSLTYAKVTKQITKTRFRGDVHFRREVTP